MWPCSACQWHSLTDPGQGAVCSSCLKNWLFTTSLQSGCNLEILCSLPYTLQFLIDLTWTRVWQNEDPKFARWQLFRWILSREQWLSSQKQTFTTTCSMPLMGEALLLLFPPYCTMFLFAMGAPLSSTSFLAIYSFPKYFPQMTVPLKKETKPKPQSNKPKHRTHTNCEEKAGVFNHGLLQAWRSPMAGQT